MRSLSPVYTKCLTMKRILVLVTGLFLFFEFSLYAQSLNKAPDDKSVSRHFVLENGLKVLVVSDPKFNNSAAALEIQAGSLMDPKGRQGLAHFLEHMLFLGTRKYPDVNDFSEYLQRHGGYSNAFTGGDRTNFHFEVQHDAFDGALDRFSQFFISPLFSPKYSQREMNAVDSEHQKNREQDDWRAQQLFDHFYRKNHPANHFATGDLETLKGVKQEEFIRFYNKYYSANRMSLVLLGNKSPDELEALARKYFLPIKNNHVEKIKFDPNYLDDVKGFRLIKRLPVKDIRELAMEFSIPSYIKDYTTKPAMLIGFCIGHEGKGSILSYLKKQGLATGLSAGGGNSTSDYGSFMINVQLTQKGLEHYRDVIKYCFSYIRLLQEKGIPDYIFREIQRIAELDYTYKNKGEGAERASYLAGNLDRYPIDVAETVDYMYEDLKPELIKDLLSHLRPDNMLCMLTAKGLTTDSIEPYYGTKYSYSVEKGKFYNALLKPAEIKELALPAPNPFLPEDVRLLAERPVNIINEPGLEMWYAQDVTFKRPKATIIFHVKQPKGLVNPAYMARLSLYTACVNEMMDEIAYPAHEAGLDYLFASDLDGLTITISGYTASIRMLLNDLGKKIRSVDLSEQQFNNIKDKKLRELENFKMGQAWEIARYISRRIRKETYFSIESQIKAIRSLTLKDMQQFPGTLYKKTRIEGLAHGNITSDEAVSLAHMLQSFLHSSPLDKEDTFKQHILVEKDKEHETYIDKLATNNSCFWRTIHLGSESPEIRMASRIIGKFISQPFYSEMRTNQQLGYIVWAVSPEDHGQYYLFFIVQSESHPADDIRERANTFITTLPAGLEALPDDKFDEIKRAVRTELLEKPKSIMEKSMRFDSLLFEHDKDFDRREEDLSALNSLTKARVEKILADAINPEKERIVDILLFAKQHNIEDSTKASIDSIDSFKVGKTFVARPEKVEKKD